MCELMTIAASLAFTGLWIAARRRGKDARALFTTTLMFWGAALMWSVDCVANRLDGEPLFDLSREDAVLGAIILAAGLAAHAVFVAIGRLRAARA